MRHNGDNIEGGGDNGKNNVKNGGNNLGCMMIVMVKVWGVQTTHPLDKPTQLNRTQLAATRSNCFGNRTRVLKFKNLMPMGWLWVSYSKPRETRTGQKTSSLATFPTGDGNMYEIPRFG